MPRKYFCQIRRIGKRVLHQRSSLLKYNVESHRTFSYTARKQNKIVKSKFLPKIVKRIAKKKKNKLFVCIFVLDISITRKINSVIDKVNFTIRNFLSASKLNSIKFI